MWNKMAQVLTNKILRNCFISGDLILENDVRIIPIDDTPVDYTDGITLGTGEGTAGPGSIAIDYTNSLVYVNTGTKAQPTWTEIGSGGASSDFAGSLPLDVASDLYILSGVNPPVDFTDGDPVATGQDIAGYCSIYIDNNTRRLFVNISDKNSPTWVRMMEFGATGLALINPWLINPILNNNGFSILSGEGVPADYTDGDPAATGEGTAQIGSLYVDCIAGKLYINGGTMAQPLWKIMTSA